MTDVPLEPPQTLRPAMIQPEARRSHIYRVAAFVLLEIAFASIAVALVVVEDLREDGWPSLESVDVRWPITTFCPNNSYYPQCTSRSRARIGGEFWVMTSGIRAATHLYTPEEHWFGSRAIQ